MKLLVSIICRPGMPGMLGMPDSRDTRDARDASCFRDARDARCFTLIRTHCHCKKKEAISELELAETGTRFTFIGGPTLLAPPLTTAGTVAVCLSLSFSLSRNESKKRTQKKKKRKMSKKKSSDVLHRRPKRGQGFRVRWEIE